MPRAKPPSRAAPDDRPLAPRVPADLEVVDLATITTGEWQHVELGGVLPAGFDEPLLLTEVRLRGATMIGARLEGSRFVDVDVVASELSGVDLQEASFARVELRDCRVSGGQLAQIRMRDVRFADCRLDDVNLALSISERVRFERCRMDRADFRAAKFEGVAWFDCDLTDAELSQVKVDRAQIHGSNLHGVRGATDLKPVSIDADQFPVLAAHLLAAMGIRVTERDEGTGDSR